MPTSLDQALEVMKILVQAEYAVEELYRFCAAEWEEDQRFWLRMASEEEKHAHNIEKMIAIVSKKPDLFATGRSFNAAAINTFLDHIRSSMNRVKTQDITKQNMLFIARDIENSLIESKYSEIMKTNDIEFLSFAREIDSDTLAHKTLIEAKIAGLQRAS